MPLGKFRFIRSTPPWALTPDVADWLQCSAATFQRCVGRFVSCDVNNNTLLAKAYREQTGRFCAGAIPSFLNSALPIIKTKELYCGYCRKRPPAAVAAAPARCLGYREGETKQGKNQKVFPRAILMFSYLWPVKR